MHPMFPTSGRSYYRTHHRSLQPESDLINFVAELLVHETHLRTRTCSTAPPARGSHVATNFQGDQKHQAVEL